MTRLLKLVTSPVVILAVISGFVWISRVATSAADSYTALDGRVLRIESADLALQPLLYKMSDDISAIKTDVIWLKNSK